MSLCWVSCRLNAVMMCVFYIECQYAGFPVCQMSLCRVTCILNVLYAEWPILSVLYAECHYVVSWVLNVLYAECLVCWVSCMLSVLYAECHYVVSWVLNVICWILLCWVSCMLNVIMPCVVAPQLPNLTENWQILKIGFNYKNKK